MPDADVQHCTRCQATLPPDEYRIVVRGQYFCDEGCLVRYEDQKELVTLREAVRRAYAVEFSVTQNQEKETP